MISNKKLDSILNHKVFPAVSIFIPTNITGDYDANRIRWKNELNDVYKKLEGQGFEKKSFLHQAESLLDNSVFWANQSAGLAGYFSEDFSEVVHLLDTVEPQNYLSNTFVAAPIILNKINNQRVFLLTLSQNNVRFFEAVNSGIYPIKIEDLVPNNIETALNLDVEKETLHSTGQSLANTNSYRDKIGIRLEQYFKMIDSGLWELLEGEKVPLVLAGVEEYHAIYKKISRYKHISSHLLTGNTDSMSPSELRLQLDPVFNDLDLSDHNDLSAKINQDFNKLKIINNEEDLLYNLEIDNVENCIIPANYSYQNEIKVLRFEKVLRTCFHRNIQVSIRHDFESLSGISRNEIVTLVN